jgi:hypothetical protein
MTVAQAATLKKIGQAAYETSRQSIIGAGHNFSTGLPGQEERACGTGMTPETSVP